jgi:hypothetical protein
MQAILSRVGVTIRRGLDWMFGFIAPYTFTHFGTTGNYSAIAILHTITHAIGFSVLTSRILATDLSQSHCNFKSHVKSSLHRLIPFLTFLLNHLRLPSPELEPVLFRLLFCTPTTMLLLHLSCRTLPITSLHGSYGKHSLILSRMHVYWSVT